ncbi:calcium/sodium antiporter [Altererythrobacter sp. BO-6]|uniref:calcium/sodium antiporter n=1 Tax=Altererythrobacter sp. BO-6 TaxID=2604537 RepID=UPI0013E1DAAD|nr:calcium/sodium antiporter [Altererythrobacter sp. BO-6]QIG54871.1 calcium/sodium antiporter [Altererythrobacter sp. BO-6]
MSVTLLILAGLALLAIGGELLVRGAVGMSQVLRISPLLAGLTIVGFGTSTPELATSLQAAFAGSPGIALGNVVGSNIANILLILGVSAIIMPLAVRPEAFRRDALALVISTALCVAAVMLGTIGMAMGLLLLAALVAYVTWAYLSEKEPGNIEGERHVAEMADTLPRTHNGWALAVMVVAGLAAAIFGARLLVDGAVQLASAAGMSEAVIGLTIVAIGTSLPELIACLVAVWKKHPEVALGNVVGSNIYNVLGILGITAVIHPLEVPAEIARFDIWVLVGITALLLVQLRSGWRITRLEGGVLVALAVAYTVWLAMR